MRPVSWSLSLGHVTKQPRHRQCRSLRYAITRDATARPALRVARVGRELGGLGRNGPGAGTKCRRCADCADERGRTDAAAGEFGSYYRDPFYLQDIQVLKGPASILFGRGSTGGVVEQDSKLPTLNPFTNGTLVFGTDMTKRATADVNQPLPDLGTGAALRLN